MCIKMSDVRLSNASPTLERVDSRQLDSVRPSVRRCLFGSPDPGELREYFEASRQEEERRFRDTYNFDPVEDRPLSPGKYVWEEWKDAPAFYRRPPHQRLHGRSSNTRYRAGRAEDQTAQDEIAEDQIAEDQTASAEGPRKRPSDASGSSCSSEPQSKSSRSDNEERDPDEGTDPETRLSELASQQQ